MEETKKSGLSTAGMVLGIIGICISFIPVLNYISVILSILAVIFGLIGTINGKGRGMAITALVLGIVSFIFIYNSYKALGEAVDTINDGVNQLQNELSVDNESTTKITLDKFNQIQTGMTYEQVVAIIGEEGTLSSESAYGDYSSKIYSWSNGIANATISFSNGKVSAKSQFGLDN